MSTNIACNGFSRSVWYPETGTVDELSINVVAIEDGEVKHSVNGVNEDAMNEKDPWYAASGATNHVIKAQSNVQQSLECDRSINTADGRPMKITHYDNSIFSVNNRIFNLDQLLYVPSASKNLISIKRFADPIGSA